VKQAIDNTKRYKALSEAEKVRQKHLQAEIAAKKELATLKAKTQLLKGKRGSVDLRKGVSKLGKTLKSLDKMLKKI